MWIAKQSCDCYLKALTVKLREYGHRRCAGNVPFRPPVIDATGG
jgi:hypothetical protein